MKSTKQKNAVLWPYAEDVHSHLRKQEQALLVYHHQSTQLNMRRSLIDYIWQICQKMNFSTPVMHLAAYYLDAYMDNYTIGDDQLELLGMGCVIVAVKVEEKDYLIPTMSQCNEIMHRPYELREFVQMEISIMTFLNWKLLVPTTAVFVEYYAQFCGPAPGTEEAALLPLKTEEILMVLLQYIGYFLDLTVLDNKFRDFSPSIIASAIVAMSRTCLLLTVVWNVQLQEITHYSMEDIDPCLTYLKIFLRRETHPANYRLLHHFIKKQDEEDKVDKDQTENEVEDNNEYSSPYHKTQNDGHVPAHSHDDYDGKAADGTLGGVAIISPNSLDCDLVVVR